MGVSIKKIAADPATLPVEPVDLSPISTPIQAKPEKKNGKTPAPDSANLDHILAAVRKEKGDKIAVKGSQIPDVERIHTGVCEFDVGTGGGFPKGRITIVYGVESSGKTNLALKAIAYIQKYYPPGKNRCAFINLEGTFDPAWATKMGVDVDQLDVINPAYGEEAVDITDAVLRASDLAICVVDSIAVMVSSKEIAKSVETADMGTSAILIKRLCNKAVIALAEEARKDHYPALVLINQRRFKVGVMFGDPETMPGGETMKFLSSLTVRLYGKNIVDKNYHPDIPCWKDTSVIVKKAKIPVTSANFEYKMAMMPVGDIDIGDTDSWNFVSGYLKSNGTLVKEKEGWRMKMPNLKPAIMPTLAGWEEQYVCDLGFRVNCQQEVVKMLQDKKFTVAEKEESAPAVDK
jgi:recombination protein RecA